MCACVRNVSICKCRLLTLIRDLPGVQLKVTLARASFKSAPHSPPTSTSAIRADWLAGDSRSAAEWTEDGSQSKRACGACRRRRAEPCARKAGEGEMPLFAQDLLVPFCEIEQFCRLENLIVFLLRCAPIRGLFLLVHLIFGWTLFLQNLQVCRISSILTSFSVFGAHLRF